jgi:predicted nucleic acid-binding protein
VHGLREDLVLPALTLVEIDYWLRRANALDTWLAFVAEIEAGGYRLAAPSPRELLRAAELEASYADLRLGVVDASVIVTCESLGETKVATLDRRHFAAVRPRHCEALTLLPE